MQVAALKDDMGFSSLVCLYCLFDVLTAKIREERHVEISKRLKTCEIIMPSLERIRSFMNEMEDVISCRQ